MFRGAKSGWVQDSVFIAENTKPQIQPVDQDQDDIARKEIVDRISSTKGNQSLDVQ